MTGDMKISEIELNDFSFEVMSVSVRAQHIWEDGSVCLSQDLPLRTTCRPLGLRPVSATDDDLIAEGVGLLSTL